MQTLLKVFGQTAVSRIKRSKHHFRGKSSLQYIILASLFLATLLLCRRWENEADSFERILKACAPIYSNFEDEKHLFEQKSIEEDFEAFRVC